MNKKMQSLSQNKSGKKKAQRINLSLPCKPLRCKKRIIIQPRYMAEMRLLIHGKKKDRLSKPNILKKDHQFRLMC
jgi:hypothetical protein